MSPLEIVLLSLLAGALALFLIGACIYTGWMLYTSKAFLANVLDLVRASIESSKSDIQSTVKSAVVDISLLREKIDAILANHRIELHAIAQSTSQDISLLKGQIDTILNTHRQEMQTVISRINGDKLIESSNVILKSAHRIETAAVAFGELAQSLLSEEDILPEIRRARDSGLGPESYAPNPTGERFIGQSRTAAQDRDELLGPGEETE